MPLIGDLDTSAVTTMFSGATAFNQRPVGSCLEGRYLLRCNTRTDRYAVQETPNATVLPRPVLEPPCGHVLSG